MDKYIKVIKEFWIYKMLTSNRMKSLYWRIGGQALALFLIECQSWMTEFMPDWKWTVLLGLIISEVTKKLNSK